MDGYPEQKARSRSAVTRWIARFLAVAVMIGCGILVYSLITSGISDYQDDQAADDAAKVEAREQRRQEQRQEQQAIEDGPATYVVQEGDTLTMISEETGLTMHELAELNPGIDTQVLSPGQEINLR